MVYPPPTNLLREGVFLPRYEGILALHAVCAVGVKKWETNQRSPAPAKQPMEHKANVRVQSYNFYNDMTIPDEEWIKTLEDGRK
jgi:hypothetical protein